MRTIVWFRKSLRLHDNPALVAGLEASVAVYPVFCLDPRFLRQGRVGANQMRFLLESLTDLDQSLRALNSQLIILRGPPDVELPAAFRRWRITQLAYEVDTEQFSKQRDAAINQLAADAGVKVISRVGHTICDMDQLLRRSAGKPVTSYGTFIGHFNQEIRTHPIEVLPAPTRIPPPHPLETKTRESAIPTISELGYDVSDSCVMVQGGERAALRRMEEHLAHGSWVATFEKPQTSPTSIDPLGSSTRSTTVLSPYLTWGCLSPRLFYEKLAEVYKQHPKHAQPPVSLHGQLLWREFYYACSHATPNYDRMQGNPICRQIPWHDDPELLRAWREGRTGYPWIDAVMTQLRREGWIHHLARHAVACFLTRGDLWQSWEKGAAVFDELLLDADWALNNGNWMWLSCSCFFYQYFRCYSPVAFPKKYDKDGEYVRRWLPALARFPAKYIYEPWKAPLADQKMAGCIIGKDYPKPIVRHEEVSKDNMARMAGAYAAAKGEVRPSIAAAPSDRPDRAEDATPKRKLAAQYKQTKLPRAQGARSHP